MALTRAVADGLADLPLRCIDCEYPNHPGHLLFGPEDVKSPRELHPAFFGCLDWHSAVHGHWLLVRLLKLSSEGLSPKKAEAVRRALGEHLTADNLRIEAEYLESRPSFERMYGWAWLLKLALELRTWEDAEGREWSKNLTPLEETIVRRYLEFLPKQTYPIRVGTHGNTAFGLTFAHDYACLFSPELRNAIEAAACRYYRGDSDAPAHLEPGGNDFFSPALLEADLMRRILPRHEFVSWFQSFLPELPPSLKEPPFVSDRSDGQIAHLDGLSLSRAWCMKGIASSIEESEIRGKLLESAKIHEREGLGNVASGHYEGEHWLASFALHLLLTEA